MIDIVFQSPIDLYFEKQRNFHCKVPTKIIPPEVFESEAIINPGDPSQAFSVGPTFPNPIIVTPRSRCTAWHCGNHGRNKGHCMKHRLPIDRVMTAEFSLCAASESREMNCGASVRSCTLQPGGYQHPKGAKATEAVWPGQGLGKGKRLMLGERLCKGERADGGRTAL
jgi:hypothetical protein